MPGGLTPKVVGASTLLALLIASTFAFLLDAVRDEAEASRVARQIRKEMAAADDLQLGFIQLESDARGYAATGDPRFVAAWGDRRRDLLAAIDELAHLVDDERAAEQMAELGTSAQHYLDDALSPVVAASDRGATPPEFDQMRRPDQREGDVVSMFEEYQTSEAELLEARLEGSNRATRRATLAAVLGVSGSIALVAGFGTFLVRSVLRPLRRASTMADRLAGGDLTVRLGEFGPGEIGQLERSFNSMGEALESGRNQLLGLVEEQAALRRVAALVATGAPPHEVFDAVVAEVARLMRSDATVLLRFDQAHLATMIASRQHIAGGRPEGATWSYERDELIESFTGSSYRPHAGSIEFAGGPTAELLRSRGLRSLVGAAITVDGTVWGAVIASWTVDVEDPEALARQVGEFTQLVGSAIANAHSHDELAASRARIVVAADEARRRIERDIHDGAQQRLISIGLELRLAEMSAPEDAASTREDLARIDRSLSEAVEALQEIARGVHPAILSHGGLTPALRNLARQSVIPTTIVAEGDRRLSESVEIAAYYLVSEALTNAAKHSDASAITVVVRITDHDLRIVIHDDGVGGAQPSAGSGLIGLRDRIEAVGGRMAVDSPPGSGTTIDVTVPTEP